MLQDRNFDPLAEKFEQRIYGSKKGQLREILLWQQMRQHIPHLETDSPLTILDAAGGLGQMSKQLATLKHNVVLNDLSENMLDRAKQRLCCVSNIQFHHGPIQHIHELEETFDIIVCHALLEWLAEPKETVFKLLNNLKPGGHLSLAFYNRHSLVYKNALKGNTDILTEKTVKKAKRKGLTPMNPQYPETVANWFQELGYKTLGEYGIRVIYDWLPKETLEKSNIEGLIKLENRYNNKEPYKYTGRYFHMVVKKYKSQ